MPSRDNTQFLLYPLPVIISISFCIGTPISCESDHRQPSSDVVNFQDGSCQPCCISCTAVVDHPRRVVDGVSFVIKFWTDRMYGLGDIAIFRFWQFG